MKRSHHRLLSMTLAVTLCATPPSFVGAEDIDLFTSGIGLNQANNPNVLIILDNSANWSSAAQHWPGGVKQGESELSSIRRVVQETTDKINLGLMMFTGGSGSTPDGGYLRYAVRTMDATNRANLSALIGDASCVNGPGANGTPKCIFKNYDVPQSSGGERTATADTDYSAAMFEAFKYFGGCTSPPNAQSGACKPVADQAAAKFGVQRYSGGDISSYINFYDAAAYTNATRNFYNPPITAANNCAKNYVIFIGNGFPVQDSLGTLLTGVEGNATQQAMPQFTTTSNTTVTNIGSACGSGSTPPAETTRRNDCTANIPQSLKDANPADSYACVGAQSTTPACPGGDNRQFAVESTKLVITATATGTSAVPSSSTARFADEWARYLYTTDVNGAAGQQNVATYTIDVFKDQQDARQTALLFSMAKYGGGRYFQASSEDAILKALRDILTEIQSVNSVFASASLPISATNRSQNENQVFIGMFRPDPQSRPRWYGNLKRYQIALFGQEARLADKDGLDAVSAATGFLQACVTSFWTTDTTQIDTSTAPPTDKSYWNFSSPAGSSAGSCTASATSLFSDLPDGPQVEKGGTAEVVRRGNNPATPTFAVNRTIKTCLSTASCSGPADLVDFNTTTVSVAAVGAANTTERDRIVNYTRGVDVNDENSGIFTGLSNTDVRPSVHGDVAHSRPLPVNYGGTPPNVVLYYGANDGTFRAISGSTGQELWAFIAPEHHNKLKRLHDNDPIIAVPVPITVPPTVPNPDARPKAYFFDGSAGLLQNADSSQVWVFPTMRRGGRFVYAFDVTTPATPILRWRKGCVDDATCSPGFEGIGQTWSTPSVATINVNGTPTPVVIMGGGYDSCEDTGDPSAVNTCTPATTKGNKVYVINALTGALIRAFNTDRSVPADVTLIDRNFDGSVDHVYVVDTGGNLYRIDFVDSKLVSLASAAWSITKIAYTAGGFRKFLFAPAALPAGDRVYLAFGSGDRERPLISNYPYVTNPPTGVQNRLYMFQDTFNASGVDLDGGSVRDFTGNVAGTTSLGPNDLGWRMDLNAGRGEQTVTSAVIFGGLVFFSTNRPVSAPPGACASNLGEARGYAVNLLTACGAVGTEALCGGVRSGIFTGGGLPPSPVTGTVMIGNKPVTVMIGGISREGGASSPIGAQKVKPTISPTRSRLYWYTQGDK